MFKTCHTSQPTCVFILIWYIPQVTGWSGYMVVRWSAVFEGFYRKDAFLFFFWVLQQIDEMLAGALTQEDEDAVLAELEAITQVGIGLNPLLLLLSWSHAGQAAGDLSCSWEQALQWGGNNPASRLKNDTCLKDDSANNCDLIIKQGDDVALPEVPNQPVPQLPPEAAKAEPGTAALLYDSSNMYIYILTDAFLLLL